MVLSGFQLIRPGSSTHEQHRHVADMVTVSNSVEGQYRVIVDFQNLIKSNSTVKLVLCREPMPIDSDLYFRGLMIGNDNQSILNSQEWSHVESFATITNLDAEFQSKPTVDDAGVLQRMEFCMDEDRILRSYLVIDREGVAYMEDGGFSYTFDLPAYALAVCD